MKCQACGHENEASEKRCRECGAVLDPGVPDPTASNAEDGRFLRGWTIEKKLKLGGAIIAVALLLFAFLFERTGPYFTALALSGAGILGIIMGQEIARKRERAAVLFLVGVVVIVIVLLVVIPSILIAEDQHRREMEPKLTDTLTYSVDSSAHVVVEGVVTNVGGTACRAVVKITAYGGYIYDLANHSEDMFGSLKNGYVYTGSLAPNGGSEHIRWECTLSYFNAYGQVYWTVDVAE